MGSVAKIMGVAPIGFEGHIVEVESDMTKGLPGLTIVGLGNKAIEEAKERVKSAISNSLLEYPTRRITVNLAPAELPKDGTHYDLPIALAILTSSGQLRPENVAHAVFGGELALDGSLRPISGAVTIAETAKRAGATAVYLPTRNVSQALLVEDIPIYGIDSLKTLFLHLKGEVVIQPAQRNHSEDTHLLSSYLDDIYGQEQAKRALVIAAAGHHNILLSGPPGAGKTMLARTLASLMPPLSSSEKLAVTKLHSLASLLIDDIASERPFRSPHHTSSQIALIGGGTKPKPGEVSLAHHGVLFMDEIPEYPRHVLESLRQPLEDKQVSVSRANGRAIYPADFMLVATMNPCPCGYYGDSVHECSCTMPQILNYQRKLSGPLMDRIDLKIQVARIPNDQLLANNSSTKKQHEKARNDIVSAHKIQINRYKRSDKYNASLSSAEVKKHMVLSPAAQSILTAAADKLALSPRSYFKVIKVARTIADLDNSDEISAAHLSEALQYR